MKAFAGCAVVPLVIAALISSAAAADRRIEAPYTPIPGIPQYSFTAVYGLPLLPSRYQNHCSYFQGAWICADHCGTDYQIYYCSRDTTGCCHAGTGYCDSEGHVRCSPTLFSP